MRNLYDIKYSIRITDSCKLGFTTFHIKILRKFVPPEKYHCPLKYGYTEDNLK